MVIRFEAPLKWPQDIKETPRMQQRSDHGFVQMSLTDAIEYLTNELEEMGITQASLSLDIEQPLVDRLRKKVGSRTGVCLQLKYETKNYILACDRWQNIEHNIYSLHLALRQWQNIARWGLGDLHILLGSFEANRKQETVGDADYQEWMEVLGLGPTATLEDVNAVYRHRAKAVANDDDALTELNNIVSVARQYFASKT